MCWVVFLRFIRLSVLLSSQFFFSFAYPNDFFVLNGIITCSLPAYWRKSPFICLHNGCHRVLRFLFLHWFLLTLCLLSFSLCFACIETVMFLNYVTLLLIYNIFPTLQVSTPKGVCSFIWATGGAIVYLMRKSPEAWNTVGAASLVFTRWLVELVTWYLCLASVSVASWFWKLVPQF